MRIITIRYYQITQTKSETQHKAYSEFESDAISTEHM